MTNAKQPFAAYPEPVLSKALLRVAIVFPFGQ